jgi:hypothetical protein
MATPTFDTLPPGTLREDIIRHDGPSRPPISLSRPPARQLVPALLSIASTLYVLMLHYTALRCRAVSREKSEIMESLKLWIVWNYGLSGVVDVSQY